jgi:hypothetical protein
LDIESDPLGQSSRILRSAPVRAANGQLTSFQAGLTRLFALIVVIPMAGPGVLIFRLIGDPERGRKRGPQ